VAAPMESQISDSGGHWARSSGMEFLFRVGW